MQITKCLIITVLLAPMAWGAEAKLSNTTNASCIVKITVDPSIMPLNPETLEYFLHSSSVARQAARDVLGLDGNAAAPALQDIHSEWLEQSTRRPGQQAIRGASGGRGGRGRRATKGEGYDEMMKQLNEIYGDRYMLEAMGSDSVPKEDTGQTDPPRAMMGASGMGGAGGAGGMSGGMMGGMGGGMGGGMMGGGMGGGMMGGMSSGSAPTAVIQQSAMVKLSVKLPEQVKPAAQEFLAALVENLKKTLHAAYERQATELEEAANFAEVRREDAAAMLDMAMGVRSPAQLTIEEQLGTIVDLSILSPEMPFREAIEHIKNAVSPPLPLVVMWKELLDSCEIEPTTPIDLDAVPHAKLATALKLVIEAVSGGHTDISYQIDDDVVIVREEELQTRHPAAPATTSTVDIQSLALRRRELNRQLQRLDMDLTTKAARSQAIQEQIARIRRDTEDKLANDTVTEELQKLVKMSSDTLELLRRQFQAGSLSQAELAKAQENVTRARIELARRREELSRTAGGERLAELNKDLSVIAIDEAEMLAQLQIVRQQFEKTEQEWKQASRFDPRTARIRVAKEALDIADRNVLELKRRLANLQPPTVTMIGPN